MAYFHSLYSLASPSITDSFLFRNAERCPSLAPGKAKTLVSGLALAVNQKIEPAVVFFGFPFLHCLSFLP